MAQFARFQATSFYAWINIATIDVDLAPLLAHLQAGGMAPVQPGPGGVDASGIPLPGDPEPWSYPDLTLADLRGYVKRAATRAKNSGEVLFEFEYREVQRLTPALLALFVDAATIRLDPLTGSPDGDLVVVMAAYPPQAPAEVQAFTTYQPIN